MNFDDLVIPDDNPLAARAAAHTDPKAKAYYERLERCARLRALSHLATRAGSDDDMTHRHELGTEMARAQLAYYRMTGRMMPEEDSDLFRQRADAITEATAAARTPR